MTVPELIKAGDERLKLGHPFSSPPKVDCRVVSEYNYQQILKILQKVRQHDLQLYQSGKETMPISLRAAIRDVLESHEL